jgi:ClpP class serine protease
MLDQLENASPDLVRVTAGLFDDDDDDDDELDDLYSMDAATGVATVTINGPMSMSGPSPLARLFGIQGTSYRGILAALDRAEADGAQAITLAMNTPGGEVAGVDNVWQRVTQLRKSIPITACNCGMIASAGYWIASAASQIVAESPACLTGSIGVAVVAIDDSKSQADRGRKEVTIVSRNAPKKLADVSTKAGRDILQDRADSLEAVFMARVAEGRNVTIDRVQESYGRGALLVARDPRGEPDALAAGMIDAIRPAYPLTPSPSGAPGAAAETLEPPASAGESQQEVDMTFDEFLASNPDAKARLDQIKAESYSAGAKAAELRTAKVGAILSSEVYAANAVVRTKAIDCLAGKISAETLDSIVAMADMLAESTKGNAAAAETAATGETAGQTQAPPAWSLERIKALTRTDYDKITAADVALINSTPETMRAFDERVRLGFGEEA